MGALALTLALSLAEGGGSLKKRCRRILS